MMIQNQNLYWFSWLIFIVSGFVIIAGGLIGLKTGKDIGIYITYAGFIGLALAGFFMAIAYGALNGG